MKGSCLFASESESETQWSLAGKPEHQFTVCVWPLMKAEPLHTDKCGFTVHNMPRVCVLVSCLCRDTEDEFLHMWWFRSIWGHSHLGYWASVRVLEPHLGLCKVSGRSFQRWLQRGRHSNPVWTFYHLKNTHITEYRWYCISATLKIIFYIRLLQYFNLVVMVILCSPLSISTRTF